MLTVHHLRRSQSERIVWLCEELGIPYSLTSYDRDKVTILAPPELKALHPIGAAPVVADGAVVMAESAAVAEYILGKYGQGSSLAVGPAEANFADYLYWFHFANGTLQPAIMRLAYVRRAGATGDHPVLAAAQMRLDLALGHLDRRLRETPYLAGPALTAADIMTVFSLTTMRSFMPLDLTPYAGILGYLQRIGGLPGYRRAMEKGDPGMELLLT